LWNDGNYRHKTTYNIVFNLSTRLFFGPCSGQNDRNRRDARAALRNFGVYTKLSERNYTDEIMEEILRQFIGKQIDVAFGAQGVVRGDVIDIKNGILTLEDEHKRTLYVVADKIHVVWESKDTVTRPGFVV
jgi:hypothetical protein